MYSQCLCDFTLFSRLHSVGLSFQKTNIFTGETRGLNQIVGRNKLISRDKTTKQNVYIWIVYCIMYLTIKYSEHLLCTNSTVFLKGADTSGVSMDIVLLFSVLSLGLQLTSILIMINVLLIDLVTDLFLQYIKILKIVIMVCLHLKQDKINTGTDKK